MIYLILAGVLFLTLLFMVCATCSLTWEGAWVSFGMSLLVIAVIVGMGLLIRAGIMQLQGGM